MTETSATTPTTAPATPTQRHDVAVRVFRVVAVAEAISWAGLLVGMFFKWVTKSTEIGVQVMGPVHGGIFMLYVVLALVVAVRQRWSFTTVVLALAAAVPPFCTVLFDRWAHRTDRYERVASR